MGAEPTGTGGVAGAQGVRVTVGVSRAADVAEAVREAAADADRQQLAAAGGDAGDPAFAVIVATADRFADRAGFETGLREAFAGLPHAGGSTALLGTSQGHFDKGAVAVLLASGAIDARAFVGPPPEPGVKGDLGHALDALEGEVSTVVAFADPRSQQGALLPRLLERLLPGVVLAGGGTTGEGGNFQVWNGHVLETSCTGLAVRLPMARAGVFVAQGGEPVGRRATITACDGGDLLEIDGEPGTALLDALRDVELPGTLAEIAPHLALAVAPGGRAALDEGHFVVRHLAGVDPARKAVTVAARLENGWAVSLVLREAIGARNHVRRQAARLSEALGGTVPAGGLYFDCVSRGEQLYGAQGVDEAQVRKAVGDVPLVTVQSAFELGPLWVGAHVRPEVHLFSGVLWTLVDA